MKVKFKLGKPQLIALGVGAVLLFGLMAGRSGDDAEQPPAGTLDTDARQACDDFDAGYFDAETKPERLTLADQVMTSTRRTENEAIQDRATDLGLHAADGGAAWRSSADAFTAACRDAGWTAP